MFLTDSLLSILYPQSCRICGASVERRRYGVACESCWKKTQICENQGAVGWYEGALRESVLLLKRQPYLAPHLKDLLVEAGKLLDPVTRIVPVPLHDDRLRTRGFNQAAIIARELSRALRVPLDETSLIRVSSAEKYRTGLDAKGRRETVEKAFVVRRKRLIAGEEILLIDDVFTTGATVSACADALISAGAKSVLIMTLARARQ
ncbi:MAG TPA: ComF family protein [Pyrinomonadaceae bacterium]|nr:ComF family protein [Pyrinomonadaceae bacterium]